MTPIRKSPLDRGSPFPPYGRHTTLPLGTALYHSTIACGTLSGIAVTYATEDRNSHLLGSRPCSAGGAFSPIFDHPAVPTWACVSTCHQVHAQAPHPPRPSPAAHVHGERMIAPLMRDNANVRSCTRMLCTPRSQHLRSSRSLPPSMPPAYLSFLITSYSCRFAPL